MEALNSRFTRRLLLVEDDQLTRGLLRNLLSQSGFEVAQCGIATEAAEIARVFDPDVMVVDISLGEGPTGIDLILAMRHAYPHIAFVVLSNFSALPSAAEQLRNVAYLRKRDLADPDMLIVAVEEVLRNSGSNELYRIQQSNALSSLTKKQIEVLAMIAGGLTNQEISQRRGTSIEAAEQLIGRIYKSLGLKRDSASSMRVQATSIFKSITGMD